MQATFRANHKLHIVLSLIATCILAGVAWIWTTSAASEPPIPALAADMPREFAAGSMEFDRRLRDQFPIGSLESLVRAELLRQGFQLFQDEHLARYERSEFPCRLMWSIGWASDETGHLLGIGGNYNVACS